LNEAAESVFTRSDGFGRGDRREQERPNPGKRRVAKGPEAPQRNAKKNESWIPKVTLSKLSRIMDVDMADLPITAIDYRVFLQRLREGDSGAGIDMINLHVGGTGIITLPKRLLLWIPYFTKLLKDRPCAPCTNIFVPYNYDEFKAIIDFMFDPDAGLDESHHRAWRFFFCAVNLSSAHMEHIPEILQIPVDNITFKSVLRQDWCARFTLKTERLRWWFVRSDYFRALFGHDITKPYTGSGFTFVLPPEDDCLMDIIANDFQTLAKADVNKVIAVVDKYAINFAQCVVCAPKVLCTKYCIHRRIFVQKCECGMPMSEPCELVHEPIKCTICKKYCYPHNASQYCEKCRCCVPECVGLGNPENGGYCSVHGCEHWNINSKYEQCKKCFCKIPKGSIHGLRCGKSNPCGLEIETTETMPRGGVYRLISYHPQ